MRTVAALFAVALSSAAQAEPVQIGIVNSLSGPDTAIAENLTNGYLLALEDLKARGVAVQAVWHDDTGKPQVGAGAVERLAAQPEVAAVVGAYASSVTSAVARAAERLALPLVVPASAKEEITREGAGWVFRVSATTGDYATALLDLATGLGKPRTIAIVHESTDFGVSGARSARAQAQAKGLEVVFEQAYESHERDFRPMLLRAKEARPDVVFLVSYVLDAMLLLEQSREIGLSPMAFLGAGAGYATTVFARDRDASHAVFSSAQWTPDVSVAARRFAARYEERFGKPPTYHAATAYASLTIVGEVAARAGGDRAKVRAALDGGRWDGVAGPVRFEDVDGYTNQNRLRMLVEQVQDGRHATVWPRDIATRRPIWPYPGANGPGSVAASGEARGSRAPAR